MINNSIKYLISGLCLAVSGCAAVPPEITIQERPTPIVCNTGNKPDALSLKDTPPTLVRDPVGQWGYWFDSNTYADIAENISAMRRWMNQSRSIRQGLVECITDHNLQLGADGATVDSETKK